MSNVYHSLASGPLTQNWSNTGLISADDNWNNVPSIMGYRGDDITTATGVDPQTLTGDGTVTVDVNANLTTPDTTSTGGVAEFQIANPTVALNGSGTADAPNLVLHLDTTGRQNVTVAFNARDIDGSADNAAQQVAVQYRIGATGAWINIPAGYIADATTAGSATQVTPVSITLPAAANNQAQVQVRIITANAVGNDEWVGIDDIVVDSGAINGSTISIAPGALAQAEGNAGTTAYAFAVTRSESSADTSVTLTATGANGLTAADIASVTVDGVPVAGFALGNGFVVPLTGGATTANIVVNVVGDTAVESDEAFTLTLSGPTGGYTLANAAAVGTITNDDTPPVTVTRIHDIQGNPGNQASNAVGGFDNRDGSPLKGQVVTVEAIVVGDFQNGDADNNRNLGGFYLQELAANWDTGPDAARTSEGIFVFANNFGPDVKAGDLVRVTGTVSENFGQTQLSSITNVTIVQSGAVADVSTMAVEVNLPAAGVSRSQEGTYQPDLEAYEGMLVKIPQTMTVTEQFDLDRFNEIKLYAGSAPGDRPAQYTHENAPSVAGNTAHLQEIGARTITYDDGLNTQNNPIGTLDGFGPSYTTANAVRMGDTVTNLTGVLDYQWAGASASGSTWRVRAIDNGDNTFVNSASPREATPDDVGGRLKVGSFNVLNFFTTLDDFRSSNNNPQNVGPSNLEPRGANDYNWDGVGLEPGQPGYVPDLTEFNRQVEKLVNVLAELDSDVLGLVELENNFGIGASGNALEELVDRLNAKVGAGTYAWVYPGQNTVGGDAISVGYLYKPAKVHIAPGTTVQILSDADLPGLGLSNLIAQSSVGGVFDGANTSRNVVAVTWQEIATGEQFTTAANHFKSKGSGPTSGTDADQGDGAGAWNQQRVLAATALAAWLATDPTGTTDDDYIILGDLNSYFKEDPIAYLESQGYTNLQAALLANPYSYVFDGQIGALDYLLANQHLLEEITGITEWHINSDEADALDYNIDFGKDQAIFDAGSLVRVSDHDPLLLGLFLNDLDNTFIGAASADLLRGGLGNDVVDGGAGADILTGDAGNDALYGGYGADTISGGDGNDSIFGLTENDRISGGAGDDGIAGEDGDDILDGDAGADYILGGAGDDTINGGTDNDALFGDAGRDIILGGSGNDSIDGGSGSDLVHGNAGADYISGGADGDELHGDDGDDAIFGGEGFDVIHGGEGADSLDGGDDTDYIFGGAGIDWLFGQSGNDGLHGGDDNDVVFGGDGTDSLWGNAGADQLDGGAGNDILEGGQGADTFSFAKGWGADRIQDFDDGADIINIVDPALTSFSQLTITQVGGDTLVTFDGNSITLVNTQAQQISSSDFYNLPT